jgi:hypothetical protein
MNSSNWLKSTLLVVGLWTGNMLMGNDCGCPKNSIKNLIEKHKDPNTKDIVFIKASVIGPNKHVYTEPSHEAMNVKISQYWSDKPLSFSSDTLVVAAYTGPCSIHFQKDLSYLFVLSKKNGSFLDAQCSGTALFSDYSDEIGHLGQVRNISDDLDQTKPKRSKKEKRTQLVIWLIVSLTLNFFAIMLIVILKREK